MKTIDDLREALFTTIDGVKSGAMSVDKAKVIGDLSQTIINSAKVEVEHMRVTNGNGTGFIADKQIPSVPRLVKGHAASGSR